MALHKDQEPLDQEAHVLQSETLQAEWEALVNAIGQHAEVIHSAAELQPGHLGIVLIACPPENVHLVDQEVMECLVVEPQHRRNEDDRHIITVRFRSWWRKSVPVLLDPDGELFHYRYEVQDDDHAPTDER